MGIVPERFQVPMSAPTASRMKTAEVIEPMADCPAACTSPHW